MKNISSMSFSSESGNEGWEEERVWHEKGRRRIKKIIRFFPFFRNTFLSLIIHCEFLRVVVHLEAIILFALFIFNVFV
jgi:hypothetical protein